MAARPPTHTPLTATNTALPPRGAGVSRPTAPHRIAPLQLALLVAEGGDVHLHGGWRDPTRAGSGRGYQVPSGPRPPGKRRRRSHRHAARDSAHVTPGGAVPRPRPRRWPPALAALCVRSKGGREELRPHARQKLPRRGRLGVFEVEWKYSVKMCEKRMAAR